MPSTHFIDILTYFDDNWHILHAFDTFYRHLFIYYKPYSNDSNFPFTKVVSEVLCVVSLSDYKHEISFQIFKFWSMSTSSKARAPFADFLLDKTSTFSTFFREIDDSSVLWQKIWEKTWIFWSKDEISF